MSYGTELVVVMPGLVPGIHALLGFGNEETWMAGNALCPAMTEQVALQ